MSSTNLVCGYLYEYTRVTYKVRFMQVMQRGSSVPTPNEVGVAGWVPLRSLRRFTSFIMTGSRKLLAATHTIHAI